MEFQQLLHELHLGPAPSDGPLPPPITELLSPLQQQLIGASSDPSQCCALIGRVERLFQAADPDWLCSAASREEGWAELREGYVSVVCALIGCAHVPPQEEGGAPAYHGIPSRALCVCSALTALLGTLGRCEDKRGAELVLAVAPQMWVSAVTHMQDQPWATPTSRRAACRLQEALLGAGRWKDSAHFLSGDQEEGGPSMMGGVLDALRLSRECLLHQPDAATTFTWTLMQVTPPLLPSLLHRLLPPSLLLNDHHSPERCIMGVQCLHHIVKNTPASDLLHLNRFQLLYQALLKHLYTTDADVVQCVLPCLLDLLLVQEKPRPLSKDKPHPISQNKLRLHDEVLRLVLTNMEAEHKVSLRRVYAAALPPLIDRVGVAVCRHLLRLQRVMLAYLDIAEHASCMLILTAIHKTICHAWIR